MADERLSASFSIDISQLQAGLNKANKMIRESESEFKAAAAGMDNWKTSSDGLNARIKYLTTATELQEKQVEALNQEYKRLIDEGLDPTSTKAVQFRIKINQQTSALNKNQKELKEQKEALNDLDYSQQQTTGSNDMMNTSVSKSGKSLKGLKAGGAIAVAAIAAIAAAAIAATKKLLSLADSTRELRTEMGKLETGFTIAGFSAEDATNTYNDLYKVLGDSSKATEAASHLAQLADSQQDLSTWTEIATGVYATFGDSLPIESLAEAANETSKTGSITGALADALNWAGVNEDDFQKKLDACNSEQERQALITETLNDLYKDAADKYKDLNAEIIEANDATNQLEQAQADLGAAVEPVTTQLTNLKTMLLTEFTPAIKEVVQGMSDILNGVDGASESLANSVGKLIDGVLQKLIEALPILVDAVIKTVLLLAQTIIEQLPTLVDVILQIIEQIAITLAELAPTLIPVIVDTIVALVDTIISHIDLIIDAASQLILGLAEGLMTALPQLIARVPAIITAIVTTLFKQLPKIVQLAVTLIATLANGLLNALPELIMMLPQLIVGICNALLFDGIPALIDAGKQLLSGLFEGLLNPKVIWEKIKQLGNTIIDKFKSFFGIHSPSRLMRDSIGTFLGEGLALGIGNGFEDDIDKVNNGIIQSLESIQPNIDIGTSANGLNGSNTSSNGGVVINQYNTYSKAHSRYELYKSKKATAAAVRLAVGGKI